MNVSPQSTSATDDQKTPFRQVVDDLTNGCGCACHTGTGYRTSCEHCFRRSTSGTHEHQWAADSFHSGFGCVDCQASYWDWSQARIKRLERALYAMADQDAGWREYVDLVLSGRLDAEAPAASTGEAT